MDINSSSQSSNINRLSDSSNITVPNKNQTVLNSNNSSVEIDLPNTTSTSSIKGQNIASNFQVDNIERQPIAAKTPLLNSATIEQAQSVVIQLNQQPQQIDRSLEFQVDEASGRTVITVKERATGEILKQIPSEEIVQLGVRLKELADSLQGSNGNELTGLFLKRQV